QLFTGECRPEIRITATIQLQHFLFEHSIMAAIGRLAAQAVHQSGITLAAPTFLQSPQLSSAQPEQFRGLGLRTLALLNVAQNPQPIPFPLTHLDPVSLEAHFHVLLAKWLKRTFLLA